MKDKSESEFEKLLAESNIDLEQVLSEKKEQHIKKRWGYLL